MGIDYTNGSGPSQFGMDAEMQGLFMAVGFEF
jgi:hypothetical protein